MASFRYGAVAAWTVLALSGCGSRDMLEPDQHEAPTRALFSILHTADPQAAGQLLEGFYPPEAFGRWAGPKFSMVLAVPQSPALQDPTLQMKLFVPDNEMAQLKSLTLSASVNGVALAPATFSTPGAQVYTRGLPAISGDRVRIDFSLDKWMAHTPQDSRDLGIVVTVAGLKSGVSGDL